MLFPRKKGHVAKDDIMNVAATEERTLVVTTKSRFGFRLYLTYRSIYFYLDDASHIAQAINQMRQ